MANYFLSHDQFRALFAGPRLPEGAMAMAVDGVSGYLCDDRLERAILSWPCGIERRPSRTIPDLLVVDLRNWRADPHPPAAPTRPDPRATEVEALPPRYATEQRGREEPARPRDVAPPRATEISPAALQRVRALIAPLGLGRVTYEDAASALSIAARPLDLPDLATWREIRAADGRRLGRILEIQSGVQRRAALAVPAIEDEAVVSAVEAWVAAGGPGWFDEEAQGRAFVEVASSAVERSASRVQARLATNQEQLRALMRQTTQLLRAIEDDEALLAFAGGREGAFGERMMAEWRRMRDIDKAPQVLCDAERGVFCALTVPLTCENPRTQTVHDIGAFEILIDARQGQLTWTNLTRRVGDAHHPHIHGHACLGNLAEALPALFAGAEYATILQLAIQFVETCNPDDTWGRGIVNWPVAQPVAV